LDFIERRGSGLKKIRNETANLYGYTDDFAPESKSARTEFHVRFKNMSYDLRTDLHSASTQDERVASLLYLRTKTFAISVKAGEGR
jgi:ATP-dependent DNA helicase RecG